MCRSDGGKVDTIVYTASHGSGTLLGCQDQKHHSMMCQQSAPHYNTHIRRHVYTSQQFVCGCTHPLYTITTGHTYCIPHKCIVDPEVRLCTVYWEAGPTYMQQPNNRQIARRCLHKCLTYRQRVSLVCKHFIRGSVCSTLGKWA